MRINHSFKQILILEYISYNVIASQYFLANQILFKYYKNQIIGEENTIEGDRASTR